ncbi:ATP-binding response regulator [Paracidobacterium acidisoli]|uniref:histidine kinase n=1 Tax=Paracidobacterium acidisoli TaxID=2303751 RepID=A0A372ITP0_9BACT|nr:ATP-binding protein [Paracidobacterium acidisoli]MBT9329570.1 ATP-binding protein [Paracidobacterium acidisoli]
MPKSTPSRLLSVNLSTETDFLLARQRAKQIAEVLGFETQDQTRIATAVSEIARNAYEYATSGVVEFYLEREDQAAFRIVVKDKGKGIPRLDEILDGNYISASGMGIGIGGSRRLMDDMHIASSASGTTVILRKFLPRGVAVPTLKAVGERLGSIAPQDLGTAAHTQNREMVRLLNDLREKERELSQLNQELKETNRGVMVLYSELEDRAQELQQASEMKTRFISGVTHELRTPLNSIVSLAGLLIRRIDGELTAEQEKQVLFIQRSAQNLTDMVNDLLDLAKIEAGKVTTRLSEFTIAEFFAALRGMFRPLATNENVQLIIEESPVVGTRLYTDEGKLAQILRNFISNALKFTERGKVHVSAALVPNGGVRFSVRDTGIGIADENKELVWQEWGQIEADQRSRHKGSGLGLPLARQLATLLGGSTWLESTLGEGSTFYVEIPTAVAASSEPAPLSESEQTILMVDDDEVARYILRRNLVTLTSARLLEAPSLVEARRLLATCTPSLIFLDIVMPEENGLAFAEQLRMLPDMADLPIVLLSSKILSAEEQALVERHNLTYINKDRGDAQDQHAALERVLLNLGLSDLHERGGAH